MKKIIAFIILFVLTSTAFAAEWTILVYLDGDNNLEGAGVDDINEMETVGSSADVNVIVQFDRIDGYDSSNGDWEDCRRAKIVQDIDSSIMSSFDLSLPTCEGIGEVDMGNTNTLSDFINWGISNYPADKYMVVLWNHGGGWRKRRQKDGIFKSVCWDDTDGGVLHTKNVREALEKTPHLDIIGFDACLMGMVEVAYEMKNYADVFVGSEELEPWDGWSYDTFLADLIAEPTMTPAALGTSIVTRYGESYGGQETQSAIDLSKITTLANALSDFASAAISNTNTFKDITEARLNAGWFAETAFRDIYGFASELSGSDIATEADAVATALQDAVIANHSHSSLKGNGLSIYFPVAPDSPESAYSAENLFFAADTQWDEFLNLFLPELDPPANDNFADAITLSGISGTLNGHNNDTSVETGEPSHAGNDPARSVWYKFVLATGEIITIDTYGSDFDTILAAYTGSSVNNLTGIDSNDDWSGLSSQISFYAEPGVTYYIAVDGFDSSEMGAITLSWHTESSVPRPENDLFANKITIFGESGSVNGNNENATAEEYGDPKILLWLATENSVWYSWTAPANGIYAFDLSAEFDAILGIFTGNSVDRLILERWSDDNGNESFIALDATAGTIYRIAVAGYTKYYEGDFTLNWQQITADPWSVDYTVTSFWYEAFVENKGSILKTTAKNSTSWLWRDTSFGYQDYNKESSRNDVNLSITDNKSNELFATAIPEGADADFYVEGYDGKTLLLSQKDGDKVKLIAYKVSKKGLKKANEQSIENFQAANMDKSMIYVAKNNGTQGGMQAFDKKLKKERWSLPMEEGQIIFCSGRFSSGKFSTGKFATGKFQTGRFESGKYMGDGVFCREKFEKDSSNAEITIYKKGKVKKAHSIELSAETGWFGYAPDTKGGIAYFTSVNDVNSSVKYIDKKGNEKLNFTPANIIQKNWNALFNGRNIFIVESLGNDGNIHAYQFGKKSKFLNKQFVSNLKTETVFTDRKYVWATTFKWLNQSPWEEWSFNVFDTKLQKELFENSLVNDWSVYFYLGNGVFCRKTYKWEKDETYTYTIFNQKLEKKGPITEHITIVE